MTRDEINAAALQAEYERGRSEAFAGIIEALGNFHAVRVWTLIGDTRTRDYWRAKLPVAASDFAEAAYAWLLANGVKAPNMCLAGPPTGEGG